MKLYNPKRNCLLYYCGEANASTWGKYWKDISNVDSDFNELKDNYVSKLTEKYLKIDSGVILEGGCGLGRQVKLLTKKGFKVIGIDYAKDIIDLLNKSSPYLDIRYGDVRKLDFADNYFAGYWSLGVIEHFLEGYDKIAEEMHRVLKPTGYLFLTFPSMSILRTLKCKLGIYDKLDESHTERNFYQYALDSNEVISYFSNLGFRLMEKRKIFNFPGLGSDIPLLKEFLLKLDYYKGKSIIVRIIKKTIRIIFKNIANHSTLLILKKI